MKPHEETWDNGRDFEVTVCGPELDRDIDAPREVLARSAPEMARAILAHAGHGFDGQWHSAWCGEAGAGIRQECTNDCKTFRAALKKAGVLP